MTVGMSDLNLQLRDGECDVHSYGQGTTVAVVTRCVFQY